MIEIKHRFTGATLHTVEANLFCRANLSGAYLINADLREADLNSVNLSGANLSGADLSHANLQDAYLSGTDLRYACLIGANLRDAHLIGTLLENADLQGVNLSNADMRDTSLRDANLKDACLIGADLREADLSGADLRGANLSNAYMRGTNVIDANLAETMFSGTDILNCRTLSQAKGLESARYYGPSSMDSYTLQTCIATLPAVFLEGIGYTREEIGVLRALYTKSVLQFFSCFISHAAKKPDSAFADRLYNDLRAQNVTCWHFRYDLVMGDRWANQIESAIKHHDKLVVVCSEEGTFKEGVIREIIRAIELEMKDGTQKLFPIRLDDFILGKDAQAKFDALPDKWKRVDWLSYMKEYQIGDFTKWKRHDDYQKQFEKLLAALRSPAAR